MILRRLLPYLKPLKVRFLTALICMAGVAGISTGMMWLMKFLLDNALTQKDGDALKMGVTLILSGYALRSILWYSHTYLTQYIGQSICTKIRDNVYAHLYTLSMGFFNEKTSSNILSRLTNDITTFQNALTSAPTTLIRDGLTVIGLVFYIFYSNWRFALLCFSILPVAAIFLTSLGKKSRKAGREGQAKMADMYGTIQEAVTAMPIVKTFQNENKEIEDFKKENRHYFDVMMKLVRVEARSSPIMEVLGSFVLALMISIGGKDVLNGSWSIGGFISFVGAAISLYTPIKSFASLNVKIQQGMAAAERVFSLLDQKATVFDKENPIQIEPLKNSIRFENVNFSYQEDNLVLSGINLTINKGEIVALVGHSGSGKSTMAQLLLRFYDPSSGTIFFDGQDYRNISTKSLRRQMAVVTQETHLFNDTIYNNVDYGKPGSSREEIEAAAKAAFAHDFIEKLPGGYNTIIGERGTKLSGGERQRLAIARALLKNPSILILDEATSALDVASEKVVQLALDKLLEGRTVLMIAHRLSTVRKANRIIVLENGKILETGAHDELVSQKGHYHKLLELHGVIG